MNARLPLIILLLFTFPTASLAADGKHPFILSGQSNMEGKHHWKEFTPYVEEEFGAENVIVVWDAKGGMPICHC